jgi:hemoglobin
MTGSAGSTPSLRWLTTSSTGSWPTPRLNANPRVDQAHHRVAPPGFKCLVTEMVCWAAGGAQKYTGRSMKESHQQLMITAGEWEAFVDDLRQSLDNFGVPPAEQAELQAIVASTRADIVV